MPLMTKIVIYGATGSGKYVLALQLKHDNPVLGEPAIIRSPSELRLFLSSPHSGIGIVHATSVEHIITRSRLVDFGPVVFIPAPAEVEAWGDDLTRDAAVWDWLTGIDVTGLDVTGTLPCDIPEPDMAGDQCAEAS